MASRTIAVFGGSGETGRALIAAALKRGLGVQALYRPGSEPLDRQSHRVLTGQLENAADVRATLEGTEGAVLVFGPRLGGLFRKPPAPPQPFCAPATSNIIAQMKELGVRRLVCQTGAMAGDGKLNWSWLVSRFVKSYRRQYPAIAADRDAQEDVVRSSGLDWTLVKPFRISGARGKGRPRVGPAIHIGALTSIPRVDLAEFLVDEVTSGRFHEQAVYVVKAPSSAARSLAVEAAVAERS